MLAKVIIGWILVTFTYLITLFLSMNTLGYFLNEFSLKMFTGIILILVPYIIAGIYSGKVFSNYKIGAFWVSFLPVVFERIIIYTISLKLVQEGVSRWNYLTPIFFIQKEVFYFTTPYILNGIFSIIVTIAVAKWIKVNHSTKTYYS